MSETHFICPNCGKETPISPTGCPTCTRQPKKQSTVHDDINLDLPDDDLFDYDSFVADEFGSTPKRSAKEWLWWLTAVILLIALYRYLVV